MRLLAAGMVYFILVFASGFLIGVARELVLKPLVGVTIAVLVEAPLMIVVIYNTARWLMPRMGIQRKTLPLFSVGLIGLLLTLFADFTIGRKMRGLGFSDQLNYLSTPAGWIYQWLLAVFLWMPALVGRSGRQN